MIHSLSAFYRSGCDVLAEAVDRPGAPGEAGFFSHVLSPIPKKNAQA